MCVKTFVVGRKQCHSLLSTQSTYELERFFADNATAYWPFFIRRCIEIELSEHRTFLTHHPFSSEHCSFRKRAFKEISRAHRCSCFGTLTRVRFVKCKSIQASFYYSRIVTRLHRTILRIHEYSVPL